MKRIKIQTHIFCLIIIAFGIFVLNGCGKSGAVKGPVTYMTPSIQNLQTQSTNIAKCTGGILSFTCDWTSPEIVKTATAYLSFVKTISIPVTEPIGVIGSAAEMITNSSYRAVITNKKLSFDYEKQSFNDEYFDINPKIRLAVASESEEVINSEEATEDFYKKYAEPILIPVKIGTEETSGQFFAQIPFTPNDIASAPIGIHQMMVYMNINGHKTNTLSFELTFVP